MDGLQICGMLITPNAYADNHLLPITPINYSYINFICFLQYSFPFFLILLHLYFICNFRAISLLIQSLLLKVGTREKMIKS